MRIWKRALQIRMQQSKPVANMFEEKINLLKKRIARAEEEQGWNSAHIYNRYWKKDLAQLKRELKALLKK